MLQTPALFIHGTADDEIPSTMSERLFAAAPGPKWLTLVPGGGHEDCAMVDEALFTRAVLDFTHGERLATAVRSVAGLRSAGDRASRP